MKKTLMIALLLSSVLFIQAQSKSEKQVAEAVQELKKAMVDGDSLKLISLTSRDLSYGHSGGLVENQEQFASKIASGASDFVTIDLSEQTIKITGKTAVVRHTFIAATNDKGRPGTVKIHVLTVWQKDGSKWKLLARQAVKIP